MAKKRKYPVSSICVDKKSIMSEETLKQRSSSRGPHLLSLLSQTHQNWTLRDWKNSSCSDESGFTELKWSPPSSNPSPIQHLYVVEQKVQHIDAMMSTWTKISEECFHHFIECIT